jgi:hypothetical protein
VHAEVLAVIVAVMTDFMFNHWDLEILTHYHIQHIPWCPLSRAEPLAGSVRVFLCWTWMRFPRVVFRRPTLVSV